MSAAVTSNEVLVPSGSNVRLGDAVIQLVRYCQIEGCETEFDTPIGVFTDSIETANEAQLVCNDCAENVQSD